MEEQTKKQELVSDSSSDTLQSLKNIAKTPIIIKENESVFSEVKTFIHANDIKRGNTPIPGHIVYQLYTEWKKTNLLNTKQFFTDFSKFFPKKRTRKFNNYMLDSTPFEMHHEKTKEKISKK